MSKVATTTSIKCPICHKLNTWQINNSFRPFCSERCKMLDLGNWAAENYSFKEELQNSQGSELNKELE